MTLNGPRSSSLVQLINWIFRPLDYQAECRRKYGDIFKLNLMGIPSFAVVSDPQGIQEIFAVDAQKFDVGRTNGLASSLLGENSLVLLDGTEHRRQRKLMMPPFHGEKVKSYAQTICNLAQKEASRWQTKQAFPAQKAMQSITLETILHVVFGLSEGGRYQQIKPLLIELLDLTGSPLKASLIFLPFLQRTWENGVLFKPERFLERNYSPYEFLPFGGGNRRCIGYALALLEMKLILATILTKWDLDLASDRPVVPKRRGATVAPHNGVPLILKGKRSIKQLTLSVN
ncbi:MAG: cytochrome P450 [Pleurocapsa sp. MO_226.B13]|nr:cytochrome P450 [Pleurocapsa sp. MO_226.B13]